MISLLRKNIGKKMLLVVVWLTIFSLGGMALISFISRTSLGRFGGFAAKATVGEVNGYTISPQEYQRKVSSLEHYYSALRQQFGENFQAILAMIGMKNPQEQAMDQLVEQKVLASAATALGIEISPTYISSKLADPIFTLYAASEWVPQQLTSQSGVKYEQLIKILQRQGISPAVLEDIIEERVLGSVLRALVQGVAYVPECYYEEIYTHDVRQKKFLVMKVALAPYLKEALAEKVNEASLRQFFTEANGRNRYYWKQEQRTVKVWHFEGVKDDFITTAQAAITRGDKDLKSFVTAHKGKESVRTVTLSSSERDPLVFQIFRAGSGVREVVPRGNGVVDIIEVTTIDPAVERPFETVKAVVEKDFYRAQAAHKLAAELELLKGMSETARAEWARVHQAQVSTTPWVGVQGAEFTKLSGEGLPVQRMVSLQKVGDALTALVHDFGYVIVLKELSPFDVKAYEEKKDALKDRLLHEEAERVYAGFVASLQKRATIKTNKPLTR